MNIDYYCKFYAKLPLNKMAIAQAAHNINVASYKIRKADVDVRFLDWLFRGLNVNEAFPTV